MVAYGILRLLTALSSLYFTSSQNVWNGLTILVYVSLMIVGQYYGQQLLRKMKGVRCQSRLACVRARVCTWRHAPLRLRPRSVFPPRRGGTVSTVVWLCVAVAVAVAVAVWPCR